MIVDSSALVAILREEEGFEDFLRRLVRRRGFVRMSAASYLETGIAIDRNAEPSLSAKLDTLLDTLEIEIVPVSIEHARLAREAHRRYGRWSKEKAKLNFGDCFVYALARASGEPLLFEGEDFKHTDIVAAR